MSRCAEQLQSLEIGGSAAPKTSNSIILPALRVFLGNKKALPHIRTCAPIQSGSIWDAPAQMLCLRDVWDCEARGTKNGRMRVRIWIERCVPLRRSRIGRS
jgi:hypothetical protein